MVFKAEFPLPFQAEENVNFGLSRGSGGITRLFLERVKFYTMDEMAIIKILAKNIDNKVFPFQMARCFIYNWECDYWTMKESGETREFEIKISRADYFNDIKKEKHKALNGANYFYYVVPMGLIKKEEVDKKYGLIYVIDTGRISIEKKPQRLNYNQFDNWKMLASKFYWKFRALWREKWIDKEITRDEYFNGLQTELNCEEPAT